MAWDSLLGFIEEAREIDKADAEEVPTECPNDYTALVDGGSGILHCPWDGWQYPRDA